jgi:hypothetical protein
MTWTYAGLPAGELGASTRSFNERRPPIALRATRARAEIERKRHIGRVASNAAPCLLAQGFGKAAEGKERPVASPNCLATSKRAPSTASCTGRAQKASARMHLAALRVGRRGRRSQAAHSPGLARFSEHAALAAFGKRLIWRRL